MHSESSAPAKHNPPLPTRSAQSATILDPLQLPDIKDSSCWSEVNASLIQELSSQLLSMEDPDELHDSLFSKLYSVLHREFGSRSFSHHHKKKRHDWQLRRFRLLKNDARRAFRTAKRNNAPASVISALSHTFHSLIKQHSRARKASLKAHKQQDAQSATAAIKRIFLEIHHATSYCKSHQSTSSLGLHPPKLLTTFKGCMLLNVKRISISLVGFPMSLSDVHLPINLPSLSPLTRFETVSEEVVPNLPHPLWIRYHICS